MVCDWLLLLEKRSNCNGQWKNVCNMTILNLFIPIEHSIYAVSFCMHHILSKMWMLHWLRHLNKWYRFECKQRTGTAYSCRSFYTWPVSFSSSSLCTVTHWYEPSFFPVGTNRFEYCPISAVARKKFMIGLKIQSFMLAAAHWKSFKINYGLMNCIETVGW